MDDIIRIELPPRSEAERLDAGCESAAVIAIGGDERLYLSPSQLDALVAACREIPDERTEGGR
jgi:hypothetical protein